jgi:type I restriction enzyme S subunit
MVEPQLVEAWTQTRHYWSQIREAALQATIENVSAERYKELIFPLPPRADQAHLTREIEQLRLRTDRLRAKLIEQVQLLRERREALITAAITGDIDIPGVAA